jgi:xanthine dehydrogenase iron-sulfur cluster and FAD-binding subunit A
MLMCATALLAENPRPTREEVVAGLDGNLCRCTGYAPIVDAVLAASTASATPASAAATMPTASVEPVAAGEARA